MTVAIDITTTNSHSFRDWVAKRQETGEKKRKGQRTRDRIWLATADLLNEVGYHDLKVSDICEKANITPPVLYLYFDSKHTLTKEILSEFLQNFMSRVDEASAQSAYQSIYNANLNWLSLARENTGLMRCLLQFSQDEPEFAELFASESNKWYLRIAKSVTHRFPSAINDQLQINMIIYTLGGMMDDLTRKLYADKDPNFVKLALQTTPNDETLATFTSILWYRALYGCDPSLAEAEKLTPKLCQAAQAQ